MLRIMMKKLLTVLDVFIKNFDTSFYFLLWRIMFVMLESIINILVIFIIALHFLSFH